MFLRIFTALASIAGLATPAFADGHAGKTGYALAGNGSKLLVMADIGHPEKVKSFDLSDSLTAIAWRPVTGNLIGFKQGKVYNVDPASGKLTDLKASFMSDATIADGEAVALDFNNKIDAVRAVSGAGDNLVYFPDGFGNGDEKANSVRRFTSLAYESGDASEGKEPLVFANAYTNAIDGKKAGSTFQYALDARANALVSLANNAGTLKTVGLVTINGEPADIAPMGGFDIVSASEGDDHAYAILQIDGQENAGLYSIDLSLGAASLISDLGVGSITGFAVSSGKQ